MKLISILPTPPTIPWFNFKWNHTLQNLVFHIRYNKVAGQNQDIACNESRLYGIVHTWIGHEMKMNSYILQYLQVSPFGNWYLQISTKT